jgi:arylformamidase
MAVWPGDPPVEFEAVARIAAGDECNVSAFRVSTHTGTHIDAPWHFEEGGARLDAIDTRLFFGDALLLDLPDADSIRAVDLSAQPLPSRVLFRTRNSAISLDEPFRTDFVGLAEDCAQRLVDDGVRLVGIDYLSIAPFEQPGEGTHHILLQSGVVIVEGLRLAAFAAGTYPFIVLPLPLVGADGAPARAFIGSRGGPS